jgi:GNAT superfamily N-acetyltransferase
MPDPQKRIVIERLTVQDWQEARSLRLQALATDPLRFGGSLDTDAALPDRRWMSALSEEAWFVARSGKVSVGLAVFYPNDTFPDGAPQLGAMWVTERYRGHGVASSLVSAVEREAARTGRVTSQILAAPPGATGFRATESSGHATSRPGAPNQRRACPSQDRRQKRRRGVPAAGVSITFCNRYSSGFK